MTVDQLVQKLAEQAKTIKYLREQNHRLTASRDKWKQEVTARTYDIGIVRKELRRCRVSRDKWRTLARKRGEKLYNYRRNGAAPWHNVQLSDRDLQQILEMPPR